MHNRFLFTTNISYWNWLSSFSGKMVLSPMRHQIETCKTKPQTTKTGINLGKKRHIPMNISIISSCVHHNESLVPHTNPAGSWILWICRSPVRKCTWCWQAPTATPGHSWGPAQWHCPSITCILSPSSSSSCCSYQRLPGHLLSPRSWRPPLPACRNYTLSPDQERPQWCSWLKASVGSHCSSSTCTSSEIKDWDRSHGEIYCIFKCSHECFLHLCCWSEVIGIAVFQTVFAVDA